MIYSQGPSILSIFWTEEELSWLEGSTLVQQIQDRKHNILYDYHEVCRICPEFREEFSEEDFCGAEPPLEAETSAYQSMA